MITLTATNTQIVTKENIAEQQLTGLMRANALSRKDNMKFVTQITNAKILCIAGMQPHQIETTTSRNVFLFTHRVWAKSSVGTRLVELTPN